MSSPFIGEILMFGGNFNPRGWSLCNGQLLDIASNTALFSILGTTFGGDGRVTFALPDMRGRVSIHPGTGPGLASFALGQKGGTASITQTPAHTHGFNVPCNTGPATSDQPAGAFPAAPGEDLYAPTSNAPMGAATTASTGATSVSVQNPYLCVNYLIALVGVFPSRN